MQAGIKKEKVFEITEYNETRASLKKLLEEYAEVPSLEDEGGYEKIVSIHQEFKSLRLDVEKRREEIKRPYLEAGRMVDKVAKEIQAEIAPMEAKYKAARKVEEDRREEEKRIKREAKQKRIDEINRLIDRVKSAPDFVRGKSSAEISEAIKTLEEEVFIEEDYEEFLRDAELARKISLNHLEDMLKERKAEEVRKKQIEEEEARLAAERKKIEEEEAKRKEEQDKIDAENKRIADEQAAAQKKIDDEKAEIARQKKEIEERKAEEDRKKKEEEARARAEKERKAEEARAERERKKKEKEAKDQAKQRREELASALSSYKVGSGAKETELFIEAIENNEIPYLLIDWTKK